MEYYNEGFDNQSRSLNFETVKSKSPSKPKKYKQKHGTVRLPPIGERALGYTAISTKKSIRNVKGAKTQSPAAQEGNATPSQPSTASPYRGQPEENSRRRSSGKTGKEGKRYPTTLKKALWAENNTDRNIVHAGIKFISTRELDDQTRKYERLLNRLQRDSTEKEPDSPPRRKSLVDYSYPTDSQNEDFIKRWKTTHQPFSRKLPEATAQKMPQQSKEKFRSKAVEDKAGLLGKNKRRLAMSPEAKQLQQKQQLTQKLWRTQGDDGLDTRPRSRSGSGKGVRFQPQQTTYVHHKLPRRRNSVLSMEDVSEVVDSHVASDTLVGNQVGKLGRKSFDSIRIVPQLEDEGEDNDSLTNMEENTNDHRRRNHSTDSMISSINEVISEVDACITNAKGLRDGGAGSRSEILYSNITRLSRRLTLIAKNYQYLARESSTFMKTAEELKMVGRSIDTGSYAFEAYYDLFTKIHTKNEARKEVLSAHEKEDEQWDKFYDTLIGEYFTVKAMMTGKVNETDAFDKKVFAFNMEHGKCPVSWREIFSMAKYNLRELVCYPYANDEQIEILMLLENSNIYTAWQMEVMNRIKAKLFNIRSTLKMSKKPKGKLQAAVTKVIDLVKKGDTQLGKGINNQKLGDTAAWKKGWKDVSKHTTALSGMGKFQKSDQWKDVGGEDNFGEETNEVSALSRYFNYPNIDTTEHSEEYNKKFIKALSKVKKRDFVADKLKRVREQRENIKILISGNTPIKQKQFVSKPSEETDLTYYNVERSTNQETSSRGATITFSRITDHRSDLISQYRSLYSSIGFSMVEKNIQLTRQLIVGEFLNAGYTKWDLVHRRCMCTSLNCHPLSSITNLRRPTRRPLCCGHAIPGPQSTPRNTLPLTWFNERWLSTMYSNIFNGLRLISNSDINYMKQIILGQGHKAGSGKCMHHNRWNTNKRIKDYKEKKGSAKNKEPSECLKHVDTARPIKCNCKELSNQVQTTKLNTARLRKAGWRPGKVLQKPWSRRHIKLAVAGDQRPLFSCYKNEINRSSRFPKQDVKKKKEEKDIVQLPNLVESQSLSFVIEDVESIEGCEQSRGRRSQSDTSVVSIVGSNSDHFNRLRQLVDSDNSGSLTAESSISLDSYSMEFSTSTSTSTTSSSSSKTVSAQSFPLTKKSSYIAEKFKRSNSAKF